MSEEVFSNTRSSYDAVAADYAVKFQDELSRKPFDRVMLAWLVERVAASGSICDIGCGPGQVAAYMKSLGAESCGIDLSPQMVKQARRLFPEIPFQQGNMLALADVADSSFAGVTAFYSIIHIPYQQVVDVLKELHRVLKPDGWLLLTFHIGEEVRHLEEWWEKPVMLDFNFFTTPQMKSYLLEAGFELYEAVERDSYPDVEVATRRAYLFARKSTAH
jgi:ubiquinone/menaquinone biosynthesis C-methylase UbiE